MNIQERLNKLEKIEKAWNDVIRLQNQAMKKNVGVMTRMNFGAAKEI